MDERVEKPKKPSLPKKKHENKARGQNIGLANEGSDIVDNRPTAVKNRKIQEHSAQDSHSEQKVSFQKKKNKTGLPDNLKAGIESLSGHSMDDVKVHYNSAKPAQINAQAYARGTDVHLGPGQEKHLPHEAWHVVQQKQGRVKPTKQMKGNININDDQGLEKEADEMGAKSMQKGTKNRLTDEMTVPTSKTVQRRLAWWKDDKSTGKPLPMELGGKNRITELSLVHSNAPDELQVEIRKYAKEIQLLLDSPEETIWLKEKDMETYGTLLKQAKALQKEGTGEQKGATKKVKEKNEASPHDFVQAAYMSGDQYGVASALILDSKLSVRIVWDKKFYLARYRSQAEVEGAPLLELYNRTNPNSAVKDDAEVKSKLEYKLHADALNLKKFYISLGVKTHQIHIEYWPDVGAAYKSLKDRKYVGGDHKNIDAKYSDMMVAKGTRVVGEKFGEDPGGSRKQLIESWFRKENGKFADGSDGDFLETMLKDNENLKRLEKGPNLLVWLRATGGRPEGVHPELDTHKPIVAQIINLALGFKGYNIWLVGDKIYKHLGYGGKKIPSGKEWKKNIGAEEQNMIKFWESWSPSNVNLTRLQQLFLWHTIKDRSISIGMRSGILEGPALLGMRTIYIDYEGSPGSERMQHWSGRRGETDYKKGPMTNYRVLLLESEMGQKFRKLTWYRNMLIPFRRSAKGNIQVEVQRKVESIGLDEIKSARAKVQLDIDENRNKPSIVSSGHEELYKLVRGVQHGEIGIDEDSKVPVISWVDGFLEGLAAAIDLSKKDKAELKLLVDPKARWQD